MTSIETGLVGTRVRDRGRVIVLSGLLVCGSVPSAEAWKVTTHMVLAERAARGVEDAGLRETLLSNLAYLRAGSVGPDLHYALPVRNDAYSDLAHYCRTDVLAGGMLRAAGADPRLRAFAYGWLSHNVADSVAHPWVNGFVGDAFHGPLDFFKPLPGTSVNRNHGKLEAWVNARLLSDAPAGAQAEFLRAIKLYLDDTSLQDLIVKAYEAAYAGVRTCHGAPIYEPLTPVKIQESAVDMLRYVASSGGGLSDTLPVLPGTGAVFARSTYGRYLDLTELYTRAAWAAPARISNLNLDQGIEITRRGLQDLYSNVVSEGDIFPTPGTAYVPVPAGDKPPHEDKCVKVTDDDCSAGSLQPPRWDTPDDRVEAGSASTPTGSALKNPAAVFQRLAVKRGKAWAWLAARQERIAEDVLRQLDQGDAIALEAALRAAREAFRLATRDPEFDELYATSEHPDFSIFDSTADVALLQNGFAREARQTIERGEEPIRRLRPLKLSDATLRDHPVLLIPTGGLYGLSQSGQFKASLEAYVRSGGTVLIFDQQRGSDFSVLPTPSGQPIHAYGWFEDNSCYTNGSYVDTFHPILASQSQSLVTSNVDGYFDSIPESSIVLLRRVKNGLPSMFMYPYGQGRVIVSSSYDDWGGFNQTGPSARGIIRDAIAWAKKPADLPINLPGSSVTVSLDIQNVTEIPASQAKLILLSPSRDRVITEQTVPLSLAGNSTGQVEFSYGFPADAELGIYHVDYELLDASGVTVQPVAETDSGRIVVARPPTANPYRPGDLSLSVALPDGEEVLAFSTVRFRYRLINRAGRTRHFRLWRQVHGMDANLVRVDELDMLPNSSVERDIFSPVPGSIRRLDLYVYEDGGVPHPGIIPPGETGAFQLVDFKGFTVVLPKAQVSVTTDRPLYSPGDTAALAISVTNGLELPWSGTLRVRRWFDPPGGLALAERPFSLEASGSARIDLSIPVHVSHPGRAGYYVEVGAAGASAGAAVVILEVPDPELRAVSPPAWSGTPTGGTVTWELENIGPVPLPAGALSAVLKDGAGATVSEQSQPIVLNAAPDGRRLFSFGLAVPPTPPNFAGAVLLEADNGFGQRLRAIVRITRQLAAFVSLTARDYGAGEMGEAVLDLVNIGNVVHQGAVGGTIEGLGVLAPQSFSLAPGARIFLRYAFTIPSTAVGGLHRGQLELPGGPSVLFSVSVRRPQLVFSVEDRVYQAGQAIPVVLRNAAGSLATVEIAARFRDLATATASATLEVGAETTIEVPVPAHTPSGRHELVLSASDAVHGAAVFRRVSINVAGTEAALTVATDRNLYVTGATIQTNAQVTNGPLPLGAAGLHLEISTPCAPVPEGETYRFDTWDGAQWVERAVRDRGPVFETDQVDLAAYWPDPDGEFKARIRQDGSSPAQLDYLALVSGGALIAPTAAAFESGGDILADLLVSDNMGPDVAGQAIVVRFPAAAAPSLLYRAREGDPTCFPTLLWQRDVPLEMAGGAVVEVEDSVVATTPGQYIFSGAVRNRDGNVLAQASTVFEIVSGNLAVSAKTDLTLYRTGTPVTVSGSLRNLGTADEPDAFFSLTLQARSCETLVHTEPVALAAGEARPYTVSFVPSEFCPNETALGLVARLLAPSGSAQSEWSFRADSPALDVSFNVPDPAVRLVRSSVGLVAAEEGDLDAATKTDTGALQGTLPFPVVLDGVRYRGFWQSVDGFVELVPEDVPLPTGLGGGCLEYSGSMAILAGLLTDLDASASGFVGHKRYPAGSADRAGRVFAKETFVFFWDAPARFDTQHNRFQVLLAEDGLIRIDQGEISAFVLPPGICSQTGLSLPPGRVLAFNGQAPFGLRLEAGVGRSPFQGSIVIRNDGGFPGTMSLDYGRAGGTRTAEALTVAAGESRTITFTDAITAPTIYTLLASGDASFSLEKAVSPSEGLLVRYTGPAEFAPGPAALPFQLTKAGGVEGKMTATFTLTGPGGSETLTRTYDLEPGIPTEDFVTFDLLEGVSTLTIAAPGVTLEAHATMLRVGPGERVSFTAAAGIAENGVLHIGADISNTGLRDFAGEIQVEAVGGSRTSVTVPTGQTSRFDVTADLAVAATGTNTYIVRLVSESGLLISETAITHDVVGPRVLLVESPAGTTLEPGGSATLRFRLRNGGDQRALGTLSFTVFDEDRQTNFDLPPGGETEVAFDILLPDDVEQKIYPGRYVIRTQGTADVSGQVNFTVNGIALAVEAGLDKDAYADGETAHLTVNVTNGRPALGTDYLVRVHYASFDETRPITITGSAGLVFDIPLPQVTGEPVFLGISHPDGRSLYINTLHIRRADALATISLDEQVYQPGASVALTATAASAGTLTLAAPGYSETINVSGPVSRSFTLPADLPGGTYFVTWSFTGSAGSASGSVPFDVAGLRVRVFQATLDKGRYDTGDAIQTTLQINTNQATSATLRAFILDPEGLSQLAGETTVALSPEADLLATHTWPFECAIAGLHRLVYGIYQPGSDTLLASGSLAFDVGNAAVLGVRTDKAEYPAPDTPVEATVSAFVSGPASLRLEVDGESMAAPDVTGIGIVELTATLSGIAPGPHELVAVMEGAGYSSRASTTFSFGTSLPDLVPGLATARPVSGASWKIDVGVSNVGRSDAPATQLAVREVATSTVLGTVEVPALTAGAVVVVSVDWNVLGRAGSRELEVVADAAEAVREFREDNNRSLSLLEVPSLAISAVAAPSYEANVEAGLGASITNLTADTSYAGLRVSPSVARPDGTLIPLASAAVPPLGPRASVAVGTPWLVGRSVPGIYVLQSRLLDASAATLGSAAVAFEVLPTLAFAGTVTASPNPAAAGQAVTLSGHVENQGNVAASGTARFELVAPDHTIAASATTPADVPVDDSADVTASIDPLNVQPGDYDLLLGMEVQDRLYPVARSPLTVTGVEAKIEPDLTPRVLVYVGGEPDDDDDDDAEPHDDGERVRRAAFVQASLEGMGAVVRTTSDPFEFARLFRSGLWNTYVFMTEGPIRVPLLGDELREAVFRGDGLVYVSWKAAGASREIEPALGVKLDGRIPGEKHTLQVLDGPLGPAQTLVLRSPATRLKLAGATLVGTIGAVPVLTVNSFGQGRDVTMAFDPAVAPQDPARAALQGLFARAVHYAAPRQARVAAAGTVVPLVVVLDNSSGGAQPVEVALTLPSGVRVASVEDGPVSTDPPTWQLDLPAGGHQLLRFQVVLPDETGTYTIETAVKANGQPFSNAPSFPLEVARTTAEALAAVIADLEALAVAPGDRGHLQSAINLLRHAQGEETNLEGLEKRIRRAARAAEKLGRIKSADVSGQRSEVDQLIAAWERASYELAVARLREDHPAHPNVPTSGKATLGSASRSAAVIGSVRRHDAVIVGLWTR